MYQIVTEPIVWIDVDWTSLEPGGPEEASVQVQRSFRMKVALLARSELLAMLQGEVAQDVEAVARKTCRDWAGVVDEDKRPIPFAIEILDRILEHEPGFAQGFELSYTKACLGAGKTRTGNSGASPADGPAGGAKRARKPARRNS